MRQIGINGLKLISPNFTFTWDMTEEEFVSVLNKKKNELRFYQFEGFLFSSSLKLDLNVNFVNHGYLVEIAVPQEEYEVLKNDSKIVYVDPNNNNKLHQGLRQLLGKPTISSSFFSKLNRPFYKYKWEFNKISISHTYHDSQNGIYERILIKVNSE